MRTRTRNPFTTVSTAGLLLPVDLLTRIVDGDPNLPGLTPKDYHLRSGERLNEAASRAWNECLAAWKSFRKKFAALLASDTGTTLTRDEWLLPLFQELGYQCPVCGSRVEKQIDVCWRCGYGRDGDSTAYRQRWGNG